MIVARFNRTALALALLAGLCACASSGRTGARAGGLIEVFPGVRALPSNGVVEIDAVTTPFFDSFEEGEIFLEVVACSPNSREHETLVITTAKASDVHAALLLAGFEPGSPAVWRVEGGRAVATPPSGDRLELVFIYDDARGRAVRAKPSDWIVHAETGERPANDGFVFAGSRIVRYEGERRYDADWTGTIVGLASFGGEVIAFPDVFSPDSAIDAPVWIADQSAVPAGDVPVVIEIRPIR
ncbi:MAG: YdjY domain-containing protein [Phycisphaerales bacterium]